MSPLPPSSQAMGPVLVSSLRPLRTSSEAASSGMASVIMCRALYISQLPQHVHVLSMSFCHGHSCRIV